MPQRTPATCHRRYLVTVRITVVVCVLPPPVPFMVIVCFPGEAVLATATFMVEVPEPGAGMGLGLKVTVSVLPCPVEDKVIAELKVPNSAVVIVEVPELPLTTVIALGEALMLKPPAVTFSVTLTVWITPPPVPVTVIG